MVELRALLQVTEKDRKEVSFHCLCGSNEGNIPLDSPRPISHILKVPSSAALMRWLEDNLVGLRKLIRWRKI